MTYRLRRGQAVTTATTGKSAIPGVPTSAGAASTAAPVLQLQKLLSAAFVARRDIPKRLRART